MALMPASATSSHPSPRDKPCRWAARRAAFPVRGSESESRPHGVGLGVDHGDGIRRASWRRKTRSPAASTPAGPLPPCTVAAEGRARAHKRLDLRRRRIVDIHHAQRIRFAHVGIAQAGHIHRSRARSRVSRRRALRARENRTPERAGPCRARPWRSAPGTGLYSNIPMIGDVGLALVRGERQGERQPAEAR